MPHSTCARNPAGQAARLAVTAALLLVSTGLTVALGSATAIAGDSSPIAAKAPGTRDHLPYSIPASHRYPLRVLFGDTHLHTDNSFDAGLFGTRLGPEDAFRFARGEEVISTTGVPAKLRRPYDFLVVSDHSDYMGLPLALRDGSPELLANAEGRRWYEKFHAGGEVGLGLFNDILKDQKTKGSEMHLPGMARSAWQRSVAAAEKYNDPGRFTAFIGYEWSSTPGGDNLHRNVIFRDNSDRALQVLPLPTFDNPDPENLWRYLSDYQQKTGGQVLAISHNSNLSGGLMFSDKTFGGKPLDRAYAEQRAKWEPLAEASQTKGDSETDPSVSPDDEFANFERWDKANILSSKADTPEMQPFNYLRPSLTRGLKFEQTLGVNPFKFGMIGSSDSHTALSTTDADNFYGAIGPDSEPNPHRMSMPSVIPNNGLNIARPGVPQLVSSGLAAVWATENTRAAIFDAFRRKEVYATTGPRMTLRVFAGWRFRPGDEARSDFVAIGYAGGVPMGGDLSGAAPGESPTLLIQAAKDPDGANLDRVQVIKGWVGAGGDTHEKIYDVAWAGERVAGADGKVPLIGTTVDVAHATYSNSIGAPVLATAWKDPDFDAAARAYYYVRVIEIPTPRWTTYDAARFGGKPPADVPATLTQRAYTSPIWYTPNPAGAKPG